MVFESPTVREIGRAEVDAVGIAVLAGKVELAKRSVAPALTWVE